MFVTRALFTIFFLGMMVSGTGMAWGQTYPTKPIRIATGSVGSSGDFTARLIAQGLSGSLGQQVTVENRAAGVVLITTAAKAAPDGYTLLNSPTALWVQPLIENVPWDPVRDFSPIILTCWTPSIVVVHPSLPVKSVKDLIALATAKPGELNYGAAQAGGATHLAVELFKAMAGVRIAYIPYKGSGLAIIDLIGGQVHLMFATAGSVTTHIKSSRLKALAVTSAQPSSLVPGLPTVAAGGLPGYESVAILGMFAPANTPVPIVNRLNHEIMLLLNRTEMKEKFLSSGVETVGGSPEQLAAAMKSEMTRLSKVIKDAGIRAEQ